MWPRDTNWRQGSLLIAEKFGEIKHLVPYECDLIIAISHDCDIAYDKLEAEPNIEFVSAKVLPLSAGDGNFTHSKNPRKLRLPYNEREVLELNANQKFSIPKGELIKIAPSNDTLDDKSKGVLQTWLSIRYRRHAFPDNLAARLIPVEEFLKKEGKKHSQEIMGYWLNYEPRKIELGNEEPYELWIRIVYSSDIVDAETKAKVLADKLKRDFGKIIQKSSDAGRIDLRLCEASADTEFTLYDQRNYLEYSLEYISHQAES